MHKTTLAASVAAILASAAGTAAAGPALLDLNALDRITAGSDYDPAANPAPNGGAIIGNGSSAVLESAGEVLLDDAAQSDARALNLVNSSESTVANGVNVFDGRVDESVDVSDADFDITQRNFVTQDQRRLSSLPGYTRGANTESSFTSTGSADTSTTSELHDEVRNLQRTTVVDSRTTEGSVTSADEPTYRFDGEIADNVTAEVEFNYPGGGGGENVGAVFNGGFDFEVLAGSVFVDTENVDVTVTLPSIDLGIDAMGCFSMNGDCTIDGSRTESNDTIDDQSTLYTLDESEQRTEEWDESGTESVQAAFALADAQAEYIVIDESEIDVSTSYLVALAGEAQSGLRALNAVNAAGSAVANGVNVSRIGAGDLSSDSPRYSLVQSNVITHSR
jgi:hypothetical protein